MKYLLSVTDEDEGDIWRTTVSWSIDGGGRFILCYAGNTTRLGEAIRRAIQEYEDELENI